ncbi:hypothetical protein CN918_28775 [Priestia megaterium]|nr:hypothetical protein CN918_28775 [Priestia megaterium]
MRSMNMDELEFRIAERRTDVNFQLKQESSQINKRRIRTRTRSVSEQRTLDALVIAKWNNAKKAGKVKKLGERELYYDFD